MNVIPHNEYHETSDRKKNKLKVYESYPLIMNVINLLTLYQTPLKSEKIAFN